MYKSLFLPTIATLLLLFSPSLAIAEDLLWPEMPKLDIRVVVDNSVAMQAEDPERMRWQVVRMLYNLVEVNTTMAAWSTQDNIRQVLPTGQITLQWRGYAERHIRKLMPAGNPQTTTNILSKLASDWNKAESDRKNYFVYVTSSNKAKGKEGDLQSLIDITRKADLTFYPIVIGNEDNPILADLAEATGGLYQRVDEVSISPAVANIYNLMTHKNTLPLDNSEFLVDDKIEEISILVFRIPGDTSTILIQPPDQQAYGEADHPLGVRWYFGKGYELIKIHNPTPGHWLLLGRYSAESRIFLKSELGLQFYSLPNIVFLSEKMRLSARLREKEHTMTDDSFYDQATAILYNYFPDNDAEEWLLHFGGSDTLNKSEQGLFTNDLHFTYIPGFYRIQLDLKGRQYERSIEQVVRVKENPFSITQSFNEAENSHQVDVTVNSSLVRYNTINVVADVTYPDGGVHKMQLKPDNSGDMWRLRLNKLDDERAYEVKYTFTGKTLGGREFKIISESIYIYPITPVKTVEKEYIYEVEPEEDNRQIDTLILEQETHARNLKTAWIDAALSFGILLSLSTLAVTVYMYRRRYLQSKLAVIRKGKG